MKKKHVSLKVETIDLTPSWAQILPVLLHLLNSKNRESRGYAKTELGRMAQAADIANRKEVGHEHQAVPRMP